MASDACHAAPNRPEAHYAYRASLVGAGRSFQRRTRLRRGPSTGGVGLTWVSYGVAHYRQGHIEDAKTAMRQALLSEPGHAAAANLGAFMHITSEAEAA